MRRFLWLVRISAIGLLATGASVFGGPSAVENTEAAALPPPPNVVLQGELINMTDFAPPDPDSWRLVRPNRQIRLDISPVRGRVKRHWNSRVRLEGFWRGAAGSAERVFVVTNIQRA